MPHQNPATSYGLSDPARNTAARVRHPVECVDERRIMERHDMETALKNQVTRRGNVVGFDTFTVTIRLDFMQFFDFLLVFIGL